MLKYTKVTVINWTTPNKTGTNKEVTRRNEEVNEKVSLR